MKDYSPIRDKYELHKNTDVDAARKESNYVNYYVAQNAAAAESKHQTNEIFKAHKLCGQPKQSESKRRMENTENAKTDEYIVERI